MGSETCKLVCVCVFVLLAESVSIYPGVEKILRGSKPLAVYKSPIPVA